MLASMTEREKNRRSASMKFLLTLIKRLLRGGFQRAWDGYG